MAFEISFDIDDARELVKGLNVGEKVLVQAVVSSLNKTIVSTRAEASRMIRVEYNVKAGAIKAELAISRASYRRQEAKILGEGSPGIPLFDFSPTPKKAPSTKRLKAGGYGPKKGIKVMIRKGDRKIVKGAFVAMMPSGHVGVFKRMESGTGNWWDAFSGKQKITELFGPSPLRILDNDRYQIPLDDFAGEAMDKNLPRELDFYMKKAGLR